MLISGLTVEPRNLVCTTKWFSDNTFLRQGLKIDQDFSSPCFIRHIFNHSVILMTGFIFCVTYIFLLSYFFFYLSSSLFLFVCYTLFSRFHIPFFALISYLTNSFPISTNRQVEKKPTRGHTTPKRNMLLTNQILFALRLHFCWYLTFKTEGEQRFRCVSEWV